MILSWESHEGGAVSLVARVQEYDAIPPIDSLKIDALPSRRHPDREVLASYLAFGRWTSGDLVVPDGPSPLVAEAIEQDASPMRVRPREVTYAARSLPHGRYRVSVVDYLPSTQSPDRQLAVVPNVLARGVFETARQFIVPSNAFALGEEPASRLRSLLAVAVLFAADIDADALCVKIDGVSPEDVARLVALLQCVNLELDLI